MSEIKAIIVDDESLARLNIRESLNKYKQWQIVGEFESGEHIKELLDKLKPDVLFLDIQMPRISGVSLAKKISQLRNCPLIVFITAFDTYAVQAFELYAIDYILKPFDSQRFANTIRRVEQTINNSEYSNRVKNLRQNYQIPEGPIKKLLIRSAGSITFINIADVYWLSADGNYVVVHHKRGCHLHRVSLTFLESHLDPEVFLRVHRKSIIRLDCVREFKTLADSKYQLILANDDSVTVSKSYKEGLLHRLGA